MDRVLGTDLSVLPTYPQIHQVAYVHQILEETLRLWPTAPAFTRQPREDSIIGGKYRLEKGTSATILIAMLHRDKQVWGEDPEKFDPDRFSSENRARIPANAYKPFGTGQVFGFIRKPTIPFCPPDNPHLPMIMVGPGTGVAPFRGFLLERAALKQKGVPVGKSILFFGCRDPLQDFLYEDELLAFEAAGVTRLVSAFSREPGKPKTYVQQAIKERREDVWRLLQQEAIIFVCGEASRMAPDVRQAFVEVFQQHTGTTATDGNVWLTGLVANHRYLEDIRAS